MDSVFRKLSKRSGHLRKSIEKAFHQNIHHSQSPPYPLPLPPPSIPSPSGSLFNLICKSTLALRSRANSVPNQSALSRQWLPLISPRCPSSLLALKLPQNLQISQSRLLCFSTWAFSHSSIVPVLAILLGMAKTPPVAHAEALNPTHWADSRGPLTLHAMVSFTAALEALQLFWEGVRLALRAFFLALLFSPAVLSAPLASPGSSFRTSWLTLLRASLETAGAAFIKWGQWAATRPDLFPQDLCAELAKLHQQAPAHSFQISKETIESAFGRPLEDLFQDFEEVPVASGSIAQVHRAVLRRRYPGVESLDLPEGSHQTLSPGEVVAVKVRHPGVGESIRRDFGIIQWGARLASFLPGLSGLRLEDSVQQFATFMMAQVDLAREAAHLSRFHYNFRRWQAVSFPRPLYPLVHPCVLVESFEQGEPVTRYVQRGDRGRDHINAELASLGSLTLLKMLLVDNFIHADLHPGNILVRVQRGKGGFRGEPHVVLLDVGMTAELSPRDRTNMLEFFRAITLRDGIKAAECTLQFTDKQNCPDPVRFIAEVDKQFKEWDSRGNRVPTGECMQELLESVRRHRVNIDGNVCTVMITTLVLEGWQRKLDPELSVMDTLHSMLFTSDWANSWTYTMDSLLSP